MYIVLKLCLHLAVTQERAKKQLHFFFLYLPSEAVLEFGYITN